MMAPEDQLKFATEKIDRFVEPLCPVRPTPHLRPPQCVEVMQDGTRFFCCIKRFSVREVEHDLRRSFRVRRVLKDNFDAINREGGGGRVDDVGRRKNGYSSDRSRLP